MASWSLNQYHVHHWVCYKGVCRKVTNSYAVVPLFKASGYCGFWWYFIWKIWSVDHIIIDMFIIECAIRGSAEKWQIHTQWWHFWRLVVTVDLDDISLEKYNHYHVHHWVCYKGVCRKVMNPYAVVTLFKAMGYCWFWWCFNTKVWLVNHMIIVMFIIEYAIGGLH